MLLPIESYRAKLSEVTQLRVALAIGDSSINREAVQARLETANRELAQIGVTVNELREHPGPGHPHPR